MKEAELSYRISLNGSVDSIIKNLNMYNDAQKYAVKKYSLSSGSTSMYDGLLKIIIKAEEFPKIKSAIEGLKTRLGNPAAASFNERPK
jgi:hypothetical protein